MKRILFVDDEPQVLDALRALLRPKRSRWDMKFVESGEQALAELDRAPFDVIVSDMRMPGMDGATLLRTVQDRHPGIVRIVHSAYAEMEMAMRAVPVAHQFLAKPCDAGVLENTVERACGLQALIRDDAVRAIVGGLRSLPALPRVHFELTRLLADENSGVADVARVVERDPTMVAKVLQLVNSSFVGLGRRVTSVEQAIAYLGTRLLKDLTLVAHVFGHGGSRTGSGVETIQRHSLLVGTIARQMAGTDRRLSEDAFIAGVLHDIGKLILASERPQQFIALTDRARETHRPLFEVEREALGATHAELGGYLLGIWGLPYPIIEAAANHHAPGRVVPNPGLDVLGAVAIANVLHHEVSAARGTGTEAFAELDATYVRALGVEDQIEDWRALAASIVEDSSRIESERRAA
jgi:HD-like signal output (HDOD) protein